MDFFKKEELEIMESVILMECFFIQMNSIKVFNILNYVLLLWWLISAFKANQLCFQGKNEWVKRTLSNWKKKYQWILNSFQGNPSLSEIKKKKTQCSPKCLFFADHLLAEEKELGIFFFFHVRSIYSYSYKVWNLRVVQEKKRKGLFMQYSYFHQ